MLSQIICNAKIKELLQTTTKFVCSYPNRFVLFNSRCIAEKCNEIPQSFFLTLVFFLLFSSLRGI